MNRWQKRSSLTDTLSVIGLILILFSSNQVWAHATGLSYLDIRLEGSIARVEFDVPATDLVQALDLDANHNKIMEVVDIEARDAELTAWLGRSLKVLANGKSCTPVPAHSELRDGTLLTVRSSFACEAPPKTLLIISTLEDAIGDGFTTYVHVATTPPHDAIINAKNPSAYFELTGSADAGWTTQLGNLTAQRFPWLGKKVVPHLALGIEHILTGYDHILFLLSLLMLGGSLGRIISIVTAFTLAHSITLSLAVVGWANLPGQLVESVIAASIAYVAVENYLHARPLHPGAREPWVLRWRWALTFAFGLIHGFGFASVLREIGLPKDDLPFALGFFNLGVELGQIAIVALAYPLLTAVGRRSWYRPQGVRYASVGVFGLAVYWFCQRALDGGS